MVPTQLQEREDPLPGERLQIYTKRIMPSMSIDAPLSIQYHRNWRCLQMAKQSLEQGSRRVQQLGKGRGASARCFTMLSHPLGSVWSNKYHYFPPSQSCKVDEKSYLGWKSIDHDVLYQSQKKHPVLLFNVPQDQNSPFFFLNMEASRSTSIFPHL